MRIHCVQFYEPLLLNNVHLLRLPGGAGTGGGKEAKRSIERRLIPLLHALRMDPQKGRRLALAAGQFARTYLSFVSVVNYARKLLASYGKLYRSPVAVGGTGGYVRINDEADIMGALK